MQIELRHSSGAIYRKKNDSRVNIFPHWRKEGALVSSPRAENRLATNSPLLPEKQEEGQLTALHTGKRGLLLEKKEGQH